MPCSPTFVNRRLFLRRSVLGADNGRDTASGALTIHKSEPIFIVGLARVFHRERS
jgi:hypothetical protein